MHLYKNLSQVSLQSVYRVRRISFYLRTSNNNINEHIKYKHHIEILNIKSRNKENTCIKTFEFFLYFKISVNHHVYLYFLLLLYTYFFLVYLIYLIFKFYSFSRYSQKVNDVESVEF